MTEFAEIRNKLRHPPLKLPDSPHTLSPSYSFPQSDDDVHVALDENGCIVRSPGVRGIHQGKVEPAKQLSSVSL